MTRVAWSAAALFAFAAALFWPRCHGESPSGGAAGALAPSATATIAEAGEMRSAQVPSPLPADAIGPASVGAPVRANGGAPAPAGRRVPQWPVSVRTAALASSSRPSGTEAAAPTVPVKLAFRALWYLGVDPEAERTWARAINDPSHDSEVRSDLIVDMVDEGYTDNNRPTRADLPLIAARLDILERHAPYALDEVNRQAFLDAYRTLLEMYVRLGGLPRSGAGSGR